MATQKLTDQTLRNLPTPKKRTEIFDTVESGLGLRLTPGGSRSFFYRYRFNGRNRRFTLGRFPALGLADARKRVRELSVKVQNGEDPQAEKMQRRRGTGALTMERLAARYVEVHLPELKETTAKEYRRVIDKELLPVIGDSPAENLTRSDVQALVDGIGIDRGKKTLANRVRATLSSMLSFAVRRELLQTNVATAVSPFKAGNNRRTRFYSEDELGALWQAFGDEEETAGAVFKTLLLTGQRRGEVCGMRWDQVKGDEWHLPGSMTKNSYPHRVPMTRKTLHVIRSLPERGPFVFASPVHPSQPIRSELKRPIDRIREASGVSDFRCHDLRRSFATYCAKLGVERVTLAKLLNHRTGAGDDMITAVYDVHDYRDQKREAMEKWHRLLFNEILGG